MPRSVVDPYTITVDSLRKEAIEFAHKAPQAKFALLRMWSAPHFYPFMFAYDNRDVSSFRDGINRVWEWKFMCKDLPLSEQRVHLNMVKRLEPLQDRLGKEKHKIKVKKDVVLIMGKDEEELLKLTAAATFTIQTQPWRMEIDFWKSFINIDIEFLKSLQVGWWT